MFVGEKSVQCWDSMPISVLVGVVVVLVLVVIVLWSLDKSLCSINSG